MVGAGRNRPGGGEETGSGVNDEIRYGVGRVVGRGIEWGIGRRGEVSGRNRVKWSGMERVGGQMSDQPRQNMAGRDKVAKNINLEVHIIVLL